MALLRLSRKNEVWYKGQSNATFSSYIGKYSYKLMSIHSKTLTMDTMLQLYPV